MITEFLLTAALCLSQNIYHEARGEPAAGQFMVGVVTMNRAEWNAENVCNVVFAPNQFSWTLDPKLYAVEDEKAWLQAKLMAQEILLMDQLTVSRLKSSELAPFLTADHYHRYDIKPNWDWSKLQKLGQIGDHIFYTEKGL